MDNHQARFILAAYRPGGQDANNPAFAEALDHARHDPATGQWLAAERAFDSAVSRKLGEVAVPENLKALILAGGRPMRHAPRWPASRLLALAACFAVLVGVAGWFAMGAGSQLSGLHRRVVSVAKDHGALDFYSADKAQLSDWVRRNVAVDFVLPEQLDRLSGLGCVSTKWGRKRIAMVCLNSEKGVVHLFVIRGGDVPKAHATDVPTFEQKGEWALATWKRGETLYVLAGDQGIDALKELL